jgi:hypothetical protein
LLFQRIGFQRRRDHEQQLLAPITFTEHASLGSCVFTGTTGLDQLRIRGNPRWPTRRWPQTRRRVLPDENCGTNNEQLEVLYRQLRAALESSGAHADANDFYYGEMEARRRQAHRARNGPSIFGIKRAWSRITSLTWWPLAAYHIIGGYGVRALRPFTAYLATVAIIGITFWQLDDELTETRAARNLVDDLGSGLAFALQNSTNLFRANDQGLGPWGIALLVLGRFLAVTLLTLTVLGVRNNVRR